MKNLLMLCFEYAPYNRKGSNIGARRPAGFARHLPDYGWQPVVLCCDASERNCWESTDNRDIGRRIDEALSSHQPGKPIVIRIPSLRHAGLADMLWWKLVDVDPVKGTLETRGRWKNLLRKPLSITKLMLGDHSQSWQDPAYEAAIMLQQRMPIHAVLAEHGPDASLFVAARLYREQRIPWITDFRDPVLQPFTGMAQKLYARTVRRLLRTCSAVVNVNEYWASLDAEAFGLPARAITNGYDPDEWKDLPSLEPKAGDPVYFFYPGNVYLPYQQSDLFFEMLQRLNALGVRYIFHYCGPAAAFVREQAGKYGVADYCRIDDLLPRHEVANGYARADWLVLFPMQDASSPFYRYGLLPGKFAEYVGVGRPMLCLSRYDSLLEQTMRQTGVGLVFDNAETAAVFLAQPDWRSRLPERDAEACRAFGRDRTTQQLAQVLNEAVSDRTSGVAAGRPEVSVS